MPPSRKKPRAKARWFLGWALCATVVLSALVIGGTDGNNNPTQARQVTTLAGSGLSYVDARQRLCATSVRPPPLAAGNDSDVAQRCAAPKPAPTAILGVVDEPSPVLPDVPQPPAEALPVVEAPNSIEGIICSFDWDCDYWVSVALCESSGHSSSVGYGGAYVGLFQIWIGHGYGTDWLTEPYNNTLAAWEISYGGTYTGAWPYCQ